MKIEHIEIITELEYRLDENTELKKKKLNGVQKDFSKKSEDTLQQNQSTNLQIPETLQEIKRCERRRSLFEDPTKPVSLLHPEKFR